MQLRLHHISLPCSDLAASRRFYRDIAGLEEFERPKRAYEGAWFRINDTQEFRLIHGNPGATYRGSKPLDNDDVHFAFAVDDSGTLLERLRPHGFRDDAGLDGPLSMMVRNVHGFVQVFVFDPDRHVIEFNSKFQALPSLSQ